MSHRNTKKTHCPKGHELKEPNLDKCQLSYGKRSCKICINERQRIRNQMLDYNALERRKKYQTEYYKNMPPKVKQRQREYLKIYRQTHKAKEREYRVKNKIKLVIYKNMYWKANRVKLNEYSKQWKKRKRELTNHIYDKQYYQNNKEKCKLANRKWAITNREKVNARSRRWHKNNPRSSFHGSYDLQDAMNNVRRRDNNTCQWYGCGLTFRQVPIHVHHIFPRSEYPELELVEQYMITYCLNHHALWHIYRGDYYGKMILLGKESLLKKTHPSLLVKAKERKDE